MKQLFFLPFVIFTLTQTFSQIEITPIKTESENIKEALQKLIGDGIIIKNFSLNQNESSLAFGSYGDKSKSLGIEKGVIATSGSIVHVAQENLMTAMTSTDSDVYNGVHYETPSGERVPELEKLLGEGTQTYDGFVLEMDIVAIADTLSFNYVFGSEEYDEYVCSNYNDIFAFFISGEGIEGEQNMAVLPKTNIPVSINNVNNGNPDNKSCIPQNSSFYTKNNGMKIEYNGFTRLLEIKQAVVPNATYHLKLCIADVSDNAYDSGIIFENTSIVSYYEEISVLFGTNETSIHNNDKILLDEVIEKMKKLGVETIIVSGNTDSDGTEESNFNLSQGRVDAVIDYLNENGISSDKIIIKNRGETMPKESNLNTSGKKQNRRVDIKLLGDSKSYNPEIVTETARLEQNRPNPFKGITTIDYYIPEDVNSAEILLTSLSGKTIKKIVVLERGEGFFNLSSSFLEKQVYLYSLILDGKLIATKKMTEM